MVPRRTLRRSGPQTSKGPPNHRNPWRTTTGTTATPPEKSSGESQGKHQQRQCRSPRELQRRAHSPPRQPSTPEQIQPWTQRSKTPGHTTPPSRGPAEPRGPGPGKQPPGVSQHTPKHPALDTENHKYTSGQ
ncbi:hypothetical protein AMECASPLE_032116 [Ameca splendens]|uniref:Uncharacterized protein n=1 Tax=Ameca splendens TaxID=208324 RepID=A0ABV0ZSV0_9TELE